MRTQYRVERGINTKWQINPGAHRLPLFLFLLNSVLLARPWFVKDKRNHGFLVVLGKWNALNDPFLRFILSLFLVFFFLYSKCVFLLHKTTFLSKKKKKETYVDFIPGQVQEATLELTNDDGSPSTIISMYTTQLLLKIFNVILPKFCKEHNHLNKKLFYSESYLLIFFYSFIYQNTYIIISKY